MHVVCPVESPRRDRSRSCASSLHLNCLRSFSKPPRARVARRTHPKNLSNRIGAPIDSDSKAQREMHSALSCGKEIRTELRGDLASQAFGNFRAPEGFDDTVA